MILLWSWHKLLDTVNWMNSSVEVSSKISHQPTITNSTEYSLYFHNLGWPQWQSIKPGAEMGIVSCGWTPDCSLANNFCLPLLVIPICPSLCLWSVRLGQAWLDWMDWILGNTYDLCNSKPSLMHTINFTNMLCSDFYGTWRLIVFTWEHIPTHCSPLIKNTCSHTGELSCLHILSTKTSPKVFWEV